MAKAEPQSSRGKADGIECPGRVSKGLSCGANVDSPLVLAMSRGKVDGTECPDSVSNVLLLLNSPGAEAYSTA